MHWESHRLNKASLFGEGMEEWVFVFEEVRRCVELNEDSIFQNENSRVVENRVEAVGDGEDGAGVELSTDCFLNQFISIQINGSCGLVEDQHFWGSAEESSGEANELLLSNTLKYIIYTLNTLI